MTDYNLVAVRRDLRALTEFNNRFPETLIPQTDVTAFGFLDYYRDALRAHHSADADDVVIVYNQTFDTGGTCNNPRGDFRHTILDRNSYSPDTVAWDMRKKSTRVNFAAFEAVYKKHVDTFSKINPETAAMQFNTLKSAVRLNLIGNSYINNEGCLVPYGGEPWSLDDTRRLYELVGFHGSNMYSASVKFVWNQFCDTLMSLTQAQRFRMLATMRGIADNAETYDIDNLLPDYLIPYVFYFVPEVRDEFIEAGEALDRLLKFSTTHLTRKSAIREDGTCRYRTPFFAELRATVLNHNHYDRVVSYEPGASQFVKRFVRDDPAILHPFAINLTNVCYFDHNGLPIDLITREWIKSKVAQMQFRNSERFFDWIGSNSNFDADSLMYRTNLRKYALKAFGKSVAPHIYGYCKDCRRIVRALSNTDFSYSGMHLREDCQTRHFVYVIQAALFTAPYDGYDEAYEMTCSNCHNPAYYGSTGTLYGTAVSYMSDYDDDDYNERDRDMSYEELLKPWNAKVEEHISREYLFRTGKDEKFGPKQEPLYLGFEMEMAHPDCDVIYDETEAIIEALRSENCGMAVHDGSICDIDAGGIEVVSVPMTLQAHREFWPKSRTMEAISRSSFCAWEHPSDCGLHIHVSRAAMTPLTLGKLMMFIYNDDNQTLIHRIAGRNCGRWASTSNLRVDSVSDVLCYHEDGITRYTGLNIQNDKTVEFRMFRGNVSCSGLLRSLAFAESLVRFCANTQITKLSAKDYLQYLVSTPATRKQYTQCILYLRKLYKDVLDMNPSDKYSFNKEAKAITDSQANL